MILRPAAPARRHATPRLSHGPYADIPTRTAGAWGQKRRPF